MDFREIIAEGNQAVWLDLAQDIANRNEVRVMQQPESCTVMLQAIDSVGLTPFYLGEVLVTEASVAIGNSIGYGFVMEDDPQQALCMAIIDAALAAGLPDDDLIRKRIAAEAALIAVRQRQEDALIAATRVNFEIMEG